MRSLMPSSAPPPFDPFARFAALVCRELGADDVRILEPGAIPSAGKNVIHANLGDGRLLAVSFAGVPESPPALLRRLDILVRTFPHALAEEPGDQRPSRPPIPISLHDELRALSTRARAIDAVVLDAHSPIVWGSATQRNTHAQQAPTAELEEALERLHASRLELLRDVNAPATPLPSDFAPQDTTRDSNAPESGDTPDALESAPVLREGDETPESSHRAIREVLALPDIPLMRKGRSLHHTVSEPDFGYLAQSFAGIYLLVLIFEGPFDELRGERTIIDALPRIERLVLALPPLDPAPSPTANVISMRRRARR